MKKARVHPEAGVPADCHILIVEDHRDGRETMRALLEGLGYRVDVAADGIEGVEKGLRGHPDVALIDIGLPRLDGLEVARRLRAGLGSEIVLVAHTAYSGPDQVRRGYEAGFDGYLIKPAQLDELFQWLSRKPARVPSRAMTS